MINTNEYTALTDVVRTYSTEKLIDTIRAITALPTVIRGEWIIRSACIKALCERHAEVEAVVSAAYQSDAESDTVYAAVIAAASSAQNRPV
ncbi:hypothetical protein [Nocardia gipuzkoensis]|uniref:hypothetical protein n=1 Tax=Nocardia gipuzkoensis TaxID=2749991 RepID=UPI00237EDC7E|nr:hypothetical protein [Nocardia gipuzkoensis]MDE1673831.1 hypothetical protein [Nocardia gipuzkoensis]